MRSTFLLIKSLTRLQELTIKNVSDHHAFASEALHEFAQTVQLRSLIVNINSEAEPLEIDLSRSPVSLELLYVNFPLVASGHINLPRLRTLAAKFDQIPEDLSRVVALQTVMLDTRLVTNNTAKALSLQLSKLPSLQVDSKGSKKQNKIKNAYSSFSPSILLFLLLRNFI